MKEYESSIALHNIRDTGGGASSQDTDNWKPKSAQIFGYLYWKQYKII